MTGASGRLGADLVACADYRRYQDFRGEGTPFVEGIAFWDAGNSRLVVNFPKIHYDNGVAKHTRTQGWYKPSVRMIKNAAGRLVDNNAITANLAPSYFLECMVYNVPDTCFGRGFQDTYYAVVKWLNEATLAGLVCQNEQLALFGNAHEQWSTASASTILNEFIKLWNNW